MKKPKSQKPIVPISLSAKKSKALRPQNLFTPYKIEWKQPTQTENNENDSSKSFFSSMKNQLSNIKNDVEKLIKKENKIENKSDSKAQQVIQVMKSINKKMMKENEDRREEKRQPLGVINENIKWKELEKILGSEKQKNLIITKELYEKNKTLEEKIKSEEQLKKEVKIQKNIIDELKKQNKSLINQNQQSTLLIDELKKDLTETTFKKDEELIFCKQQIQSLISREEESRMAEDMKSHNNFLQNKIEELSVELNLITSKFNDKQILIKETQSRNVQLECKFKKNQEKLSKLEYTNKRVEEIVENKQKESQILRNQIDQLHKILSEKERQMEKNNLQSITSTSSVQKMGKEFQIKINQAIDQNYKLKNKINVLEADVSSLQIQKNMLHETIAKYEERDTLTSRMRLQKDERMDLYQKIQDIKREKEQIIEEYEYKLMKLENKYDQIRKVNSPKEASNQSDNYFNKILKDQLNENQIIKQKLKEAQLQVMKLKGDLKDMQFKNNLLQNQLSTEKIKLINLQQKHMTDSQVSKQSRKQDMYILQSKYESLCSVLESKKKQIKMKDEFIQRALISKINKKQNEDEIGYLMKELKTILP